MLIRDIIGPGFGPTIIVLAIALDERRQATGRMHARAIQRQPSSVQPPNAAGCCVSSTPAVRAGEIYKTLDGASKSAASPVFSTRCMLS